VVLYNADGCAGRCHIVYRVATLPHLLFIYGSGGVWPAAL
jgi:hypothetical protein